MFRLSTIVLATFVFASPNIPEVFHLREIPDLIGAANLAPDLAVLSNLLLGAVSQTPSKSSHLRQDSELAIVRFVDGEFAKAVRPIPAWKKGFKIEPGKPLDENALRQALANSGAAANPGDTVQITNLAFREKEILVDINGGSRKHHRLRDHIQVGIGGMPAPTSSTSAPIDSSGSGRAPGATLILDFGKPIPDISPDDVKQLLSAFLDFSKARSAAVQWVDTLPPEFKAGIKDRRAVVGMDHEMVIAAMGRPDHKVRQKNEQGQETEDWIYGQPPARTIFVTFIGDKVVRMKIFE
jgi:hypothetical protein